MKPSRVIHCLLLAIVLAGAATLVADPRESTESTLQRAYFLENVRRDFAAAAKLYDQVATARSAGSEMRALAAERLAVCREELSVSDLARLMPPSPLAYVELNLTADRVRPFLDRLGFLARDDRPLVAGQNRLAISPALIENLEGRTALAVTGFENGSGRPAGVLVFHSTHIGLLETILPATAQVLPPVRGFAVFKSGGVYIASTRRLTLVGSCLPEIAGVLERLGNPAADSLAADARFAQLLKERRGDLLFLCAHPKLLQSLLKLPPEAGVPAGQLPPMLQVLTGTRGLRALGARLGLEADGLSLDLMLQREEERPEAAGGQIRPLALDREALLSVPADAPLVVALALPEPPSPPPADTGAAPEAEKRAAGPAIRTTVLAAVSSVVAFLQAPEAAAGQGRFPDVTAVITARDKTLLQTLADQARSLRLGSDLTIRTAWSGDRLFLASSESALARALAAVPAGRPSLKNQEPGFSSLPPATFMAIFVKAGSCADTLRPYLPAKAAGAADFAARLLAATSLTLTAERSGDRLKASVALTGIPDVSGLLNRKLTEIQQQQRLREELAGTIRKDQPAKALVETARKVARQPGGVDAVRRIFDILAVERKDQAAAAEVAEIWAQAAWDDARALNNLAWNLLTDTKYGKLFNDLARRASRRCNELAGWSSWAFIDTLALAEFENGDVREAVRLEKRAADMLQASGGDNGLADVLKSLKRFQAGLTKRSQKSPARER